MDHGRSGQGLEEKRGERRSSGSPPTSESAGSDFSFWSDTGDLAEQLAEEEDPLRIKLRESLDADALAPSATRRDRRSKRVRYQDDDGAEFKGTHAGLDKKDIEIPTPRPRPVPRSQKILAAIMMGGRGSQMHGLTGKPLL